MNELLTRVKNGETLFKINEKIKQVLPDFLKFAITYSVTENEEESQVNQQKMQRSLDDYNKMFGTKYELSQIQGYNGNLNKRLTRKDSKFKSRKEQLDLVIVVDRLRSGMRLKRHLKKHLRHFGVWFILLHKLQVCL